MISQCGCNYLSFSFRKRILATGGETLLRNQQPDSTVISEPSFNEKSSFSWDSVMSSSCSVPVDSKKPPQIGRSSVISLDYDSDHSDSIIDMKPSHNKDNRKTLVEKETVCDSPSTNNFTKTSHNFSKNTTADLDGSDLFFSPKRPVISRQNKPNTPATTAATVDMMTEPDDFYIDDFDIDDFNDSDIPGYFDELQSSSTSGQNSSTVTRTVREGGLSKSSWEKKPATPARTPKPANICSPGQSACDRKFYQTF